MAQVQQSILKKTIKIDQNVKSLLDVLKVVPQEPYNNVIERLVFEKFEQDMELNDESKEIIKQQILKVAKGEVKSFEETLREFRMMKKKGHQEGKEETKKRRKYGVLGG